MTATDFWRELRDLREALEAGAPAWSERLRDVLQRTSTRRHELSPEVVACLRDLRDDEATDRLGLVDQVDQLLADVDTPG